MAISGVADLTGRVLAGRYRLLGPIGAGASGRVYVADDVRLRRRVAVKVLHLALAEDAGFLRRFRAEAQVAASLNHPNVMAVYDWGEDEVPFMVLELLSGGSLRSLLDSGARLSPSQAVHVGGQVTAALEYAHVRGLVHRDIKPANLLFDEHGILRVADFGLARARGGELDRTRGRDDGHGPLRRARTGNRRTARRCADLYALAVVLVEAVTGTVPAVADTAIGTLAARVHTPIVAPAELGRLGPVVERAGRPDPAERYPDAATMRNALADAARVLPPPRSFPLAGLSGEFDAGDPTQIGRSQLFDQDEPDAEPVAERAVRRRPRAPGAQPWVGVVVALAVLAALIAGGVALAGTGSKQVAVPSLVGLTTKAATDRVTASGLSLKIVPRVADDPKDVVIEQRPEPGAFAASGAEVQLVVSRTTRGPATRCRGQVDCRCHHRAPTGRLCGDRGAPARRIDPGRRRDRYRPRGQASAPRDSSVKLLVSDGPAPVGVPDVSGKSFADASSALTDLGFTVTRKDDFSATVASGKVVGTDPAANQGAARGSQIAVIVSKGPEMVTVPDLKGSTLDAATQKLQSLGFQIDTSGYLNGRVVRAQDPSAGAVVAKGTKVTLFF